MWSARGRGWGDAGEMQGFRLCEEEARSMSRVRGQAAKRSRTTQGACPRRAGGRGAGAHAQVWLPGGSPLWLLGEKETRRVFQWCVG